ncbi:MAG: homoserine dehydrogenase [Erysipelotrichaceae bacterium]|nr:homoserine dehydrogenase [Erysipelotrichaceae bacterium]
MKIGLLGHGVVGGGVRQIIDEGATWEVRELEVKKILVKDESELTDPRCTLNFDEILNDPEIEVVAECMGGLEPAHTFAKKALEKGKYVVTSNKKMLATYCEDLFETAVANNVTVHYEASCGGGIPWMASLDRTRRVDDIESFRGIFNGTTNYILERMKKEGKDFDEMLAEAQKLGYAERDPSDDIDGHDVKYKVSLSCVKAFDTLQDINDIITFGIRNIRKEDLEYCAENHLTCKLIGTGSYHGDYISACVLPMFLKSDDVFANIPLNFNAIESDSKTLGAAAFVGQGAGSLPTAHAVVQNLVDIWKNQDPEINEKKVTPVDNQIHQGIFYIRTAKQAAFADVIDRRVSELAFITKKISLVQAAALCAAAGDEKIFLAEVAE